MTLRELIHAVMNTGNWNKVTSIMYDTYYTENDQRKDIDHAYMNVFAELIELPTIKSSDTIMIVEHTSLLPGETDDTTIEKYVDVHLKDSSDEVTSMSYVDWAEIVDMNISCDTDLTMYEQLTHVLWEMTFHGFSNEAVKQSRLDLERLVESTDTDDDNLIAWEYFIDE